MMITLNRWDGVSGFALTRMAINGVWGDYHYPVTITETGECWIQFFTIDFAGNIEAEKIAQFVIREDSIETVIIPPPVVNEPPQNNNNNTPPFETRDDFPPDLHDENVYFQLPPMVILPFETGDDFPPDLHDEGVYFTYPEDNRVPNGADLPIQTALTGDNAGHSSADMGIKRNPRPIVDVAEAPDNSSAPESIPTATAPIPASNPLNGVLVTLATLGVITASAGALTMTSTALAKKKEQDEAKAAQLIHLQAEQALQAETASANYAENQQKQAQATANVVMAGKQSQANKNFWYAYALWQQKVAQALARRRARIREYWHNFAMNHRHGL